MNQLKDKSSRKMIESVHCAEVKRKPQAKSKRNEWNISVKCLRMINYECDFNHCSLYIGMVKQTRYIHFQSFYQTLENWLLWKKENEFRYAQSHSLGTCFIRIYYHDGRMFHDPSFPSRLRKWWPVVTGYSNKFLWRMNYGIPYWSRPSIKKRLRQE